MKFEEIQTELTDREVKADTLSATEQVVTVVLTLFLTPAPVLARKYIQRARVAQDANRLQVVKQSSGTARSAIDKQLQTLRAELAVGDALRAATNADIQFTVSNIDGEITIISVDAALD